MMDWDGDGHVDRKDDDYYNNVLDNNEQKHSTDSGNSSNSHISIGWVWFWLILLAFAIVFKL